MKGIRVQIGVFFCVVTLLAVAISSLFPLFAFGAAYNASDVVGQRNADGTAVFTALGADNTSNEFSFSSSRYMALDATGHRLFVSDTGNNRVLVFDLDSSNHLANRIADHVLGQPDFRTNTAARTQALMTSPLDISYDATNNRLFVADSDSNRVLVFDVTSITNGENAVNVIGQADFTSTSGLPTQNRTVAPAGLAYDATGKRLFVADDSSRVLVFDVDPAVLIANNAGTNGPNAVNVVGQTNFTNSGASTSQRGLNVPRDVEYDGAHKRLFVADSGNNRVMVFNADPAVLIANNAGTNAPNAVNVIGQTNFTNATDATTIKRISGAQGLSYDAAGERLFVSDTGIGRVLVFNVDPAVLIANNAGTNGPDAVNVIGQTNFTNSGTATTVSGLGAAYGVLYDATSKYLFTGDAGNNRVMVFNADPAVLIANNTGTDGPSAVDGIGHLDTSGNATFTFGGANDAPNRKGLNQPTAVAVDTSHHRLFISDSTNNRVLVFNLTSDDELVDDTADAVLGQSDFNTNTSATTQGAMAAPGYIAYDSTNDRLFVSDYTNDRILVFDVTSITNGENAVNVIGHAAYDNSDTPSDQAKLSGPYGLAYDATGKRLFVADSNNNRVMVFNADPAVLIANNAGTDGPDAIGLLGHTAYDGADTPGDQSKMTTPVGVAYDASSRLFVADSGLHRVLVFDVTSITNGENAVNVIGQPDYATINMGTTQDELQDPLGVAYDALDARLFVSDTNNRRVMVFNVDSTVLIPNNAGTDGPDAEAVIGQPDFTSSNPSTAQNGLNGPAGVGYDPTNNRLYVVDQGNNRVMLSDLVRLTTTSSPSGTVGVAYSQALVTEGDQGTVTYSLVSGALPPGLVLGSVSGTPTTPGTYNFTVRATDTISGIGAFSDDQTYTITVAAGSGGGGGVPASSPPTPTPLIDAGVQPLDPSVVAMAQFDLREGDVIRAAGDIDVYIVNNAGYKRLFVNPTIFELYGHLGWGRIKTVSPAGRDAFRTSGLFRNCQTDDLKVYGLQVTSEDSAVLRWVNTSGATAAVEDPDFFKKVFCINTSEQGLYGAGEPFTSVLQVPNYRR
jgi:DNA-binding beta-propeller fold protein YncE